MNVKVERPNRKVIEGFLKLEDMTPIVSDVLDQLGLVGAIPASVLRPILENSRIAGPAITLRSVPGRGTATLGYMTKSENLYRSGNDAYEVAEQGDVVVMDNGGYTNISSMGEISALRAKIKGLAGTVTDAGVRDVASIRKIGYPIWSRSITPVTGKYRFESVAVNEPVRFTGIHVRPGDVVLADETGVVIVPKERAEEVLKKGQELERKETEIKMEILNRSNISLQTSSPK